MQTYKVCLNAKEVKDFFADVPDSAKVKVNVEEVWLGEAGAVLTYSENTNTVYIDPKLGDSWWGEDD